MNASISELNRPKITANSTRPQETSSHSVAQFLFDGMIIEMITDTIFMLCGVDCWSEKSRIASLFVQIYAGELALDSVFVCLWTNM